jgi:hypothetical protein
MKKANDLGINLPKTVIFGEPTELKLAKSQKVTSSVVEGAHGRESSWLNYLSKEKPHIRSTSPLYSLITVVILNMEFPP